MPHPDDRSALHGNVTLRLISAPRPASTSRRPRHLTRSRVQDIVDGELARPDETEHLRSCPQCARELRVYLHVVALVREMASATRPYAALASAIALGGRPPRAAAAHLRAL